MLLQAALILFAYFTIWYIVGVIIKNASIIDIGWGLGFAVLAIITFLQNITLGSGIITLLVVIWGLRLTYHIFKRNVSKPEDFRYANFRRKWGKAYYIRSYFQLFMFQAVIMYIVSLGFIYANNSGKIIYPILLIVGIIVWLIGFLFEAIGDYQLKKFMQDENNKGKIITTGLWRYTRHPNYFGNAALWMGIFLAAIACSAPWFVIISPITMAFILRFISGVPMMERRLQKKEGFKEYANRASIFIPWFPKGGKDE